MAQKHVELSQRVPGDLSALIDLLDDEVVLDNRRYAPFDIQGVYHGKEDATALLRRWVGSWSEFEFGSKRSSMAGRLSFSWSGSGESELAAASQWRTTTRWFGSS